MIVTVLMVIEYGVLKMCLAFSDEKVAEGYFERLRREHKNNFVFKAKCKLDEIIGLDRNGTHQ